MSRRPRKLANRKTVKNDARSVIADDADDRFDDFQEKLRRLARAIWKHPETTAGLVTFGGFKERQAQRFLARQQSLPPKVLFRLLVSEFGPRFESVLLESVDADWSRNLLRLHAVAQLEQERADIDRRIEQMKRGSA